MYKNYNNVIQIRKQAKRDIKPDTLKNTIYNKQVIVNNLELLKNWKLVEKVKSKFNYRGYTR